MGKAKNRIYSEAGAALRAYYCYLVFNLIITLSFPKSYESDISSTSSPSSARGYSTSQIIGICFALAQKLDRSHSLSVIIAKDTMNNKRLLRKRSTTTEIII